MTVFTSRTGVVRDLDLDLDVVCEYEAKDANWSVFSLFKKISEGLIRFTDLNILARCIGYQDFAAFADEGFDIQVLSEAVTSSRFVGFMDSSTEESTEVVVAE